MSDSEDSVPSDIEDAAKAVIVTTLPCKSKELYESVYKNFQNWCELNNIKIISENVLIDYFSIKSKVQKPSTVWTQYCMLRTTISIHQNIDISKFTDLIAFLKKNAKGYRPKKSKIFTKDDFSKFLKEADDEFYLVLKVMMIFGIAGGCRIDELVRLLTDDIRDYDTFIKITIPSANVQRTFTISDGDMKAINLIEIVRKYIRMRPKQMKHNRFFLGYRNGKCNIQPVGKNTFTDMPKRIAKYLGLENPDLYTGHCFRRSSAALLAEFGDSLVTLQRRGGRKSDVVDDSCVRKLIENKQTTVNISRESTVMKNSKTSQFSSELNLEDETNLIQHSFKQEDVNEINPTDIQRQEILGPPRKKPSVQNDSGFTSNTLDERSQFSSDVGSEDETTKTEHRFKQEGLDINDRNHKEIQPLKTVQPSTETNVLETNHKDDDINFLFSILPQLKLLAHRDNLLFRLEVQQLLFNKLYP